MLLKYLFYFAAIFFFKIYSEILFNYDRFFDRHLPKYDSYDYIIGESAEILIFCHLFALNFCFNLKTDTKIYVFWNFQSAQVPLVQWQQT